MLPRPDFFGRRGLRSALPEAPHNPQQAMGEDLEGFPAELSRRREEPIGRRETPVSRRDVGRPGGRPSIDGLRATRRSRLTADWAFGRTPVC